MTMVEQGDLGSLARWIDTVHASLAAGADALAGAAWGPVTVRHRSRRPDWFAVYDDAWARPAPPAELVDDATVDLVTAAIADVPESLGPPPVRTPTDAEGVFLARHQDHDGVIAWNARSRRGVHLRHGPPDDFDVVNPLRPLVHWTVTEHGGVLVHAAAVGRRRRAGDLPRGLLLVGDAGFGKSTSTLACLERGWVTCGDDAVALFERPDGWWAEAVYGAVKTKIDAVHGIPPGIAVRSWTIRDRKWAHRLTGTDARTLVDAVHLAAVVVLRPDADPEGDVVAVDGAIARTAAAPSTIASNPDRQDLVLRVLGRVCHDLPSAALPRRGDLGRTVADLDEILTRSEPTLSAVIPVHNGADFVGDAISSITAQTIGRIEIVVVDDASTDGSVEVVARAREAVVETGATLTVLRHDVNAGVAATRNRGIAAAGADLLAFLDQDDRWTPDHVATLHHALRSQDADAAFGRVVFADLDHGALRPWVREEWFVGDHPGHVPGAALVRRPVFDHVGALDQTVGTYDDVDWYLRLRDSDCAVATVDHVVLERRVHTANQSRHLARESGALLSVVRSHLDRTRVAERSLLELDVVIPVYNGVEHLHDAVQSALAQEGADVRVVVVDDGSTDGVAEVVASWGDPRIAIARHDTNRGIGAGRNTGAQLGGREWLAFLDADDRWPPDRTRRLAGPLAGTPDAVAVGLVAAGPDLDACADADPAELPRALLAGGILCRRATFARVGPFDETLRVGEFVEWMDRARRSGVHELNVPVVSLMRRVHGGNTTLTRRAEFADYLRVVAIARARSRP